MYTDLIIKATGCPTAEAKEVEQLMRDEYSTLDHLPLAKFNKCAKECYGAVKFMRTPEGIAYVNSLQSQMS